MKFYEDNPTWVRPASRMNEVTSWVKDSLEDLSISRPSKRLAWGITVPDDPSQVIYVWVDALINYITKAGYPGWTPGHESDGGWPADVHVIGKDILRFHCVYWPALLLALDLPLPKAVLSHAHWTMDRKKMSKSRGTQLTLSMRWSALALTRCASTCSTKAGLPTMPTTTTSPSLIDTRSFCNGASATLHLGSLHPRCGASGMWYNTAMRIRPRGSLRTSFLLSSTSSSTNYLPRFHVQWSKTLTLPVRLERSCTQRAR